MIDKNSADLYFEEHQRMAEWFGFGDEARTGAVAAARRMLSRALRRAMSDTEATYAEGDPYRDEYAVYEQALHILLTNRVADGTTNVPYPDAMPSQANIPANHLAQYAPEALRWLGAVAAVSCVRGS